MNAIYQYAILEREGYSQAAGEVRQTPPTRPSEPTPATQPSEPIEPIKEEEPVATTQPTTTEGGSTTQSGGTTIHIYGAGTTTTSYGEHIALDPLKETIVTSTTDPNAAILPSVFGGGGGGFGLPSSKKKGAAVKRKTLLPAMAVLTGLAIMILKPLK